MLPDASAFEVLDPVSYRLLALGHECGEPTDGEHSFSCSHGNGALLTYYFGKGKREVLVRNGPDEGVHALLGTRWARGHREWTLDW